MARAVRKQPTEEEFINWWLKKYHNIDLTGVKKAHPEWMDEPEKHTRDFYRAYAVTQEQHDEWYDWAIKRIMKHYRMGRKRAEESFCFDYLNVAPNITDSPKV